VVCRRSIRALLRGDDADWFEVTPERSSGFTRSSAREAGAHALLPAVQGEGDVELREFFATACVPVSASAPRSSGAARRVGEARTRASVTAGFKWINFFKGFLTEKD
jgi:hypothetical protein